MTLTNYRSFLITDLVGRYLAFQITEVMLILTRKALVFHIIVIMRSVPSLAKSVELTFSTARCL